MRRRVIYRPAAEVELFPFLSILACTIGTLILLIIVLTTQIFSDQNAVTIIAETEGGKNLKKVLVISNVKRMELSFIREKNLWQKRIYIVPHLPLTSY